jgi:CRP-like cAMP-binding protein
MKLIESTSAFERFCNKLRSLTPLSITSLTNFASVLYERKIKKGEFLLREGQVCREVYFISRGCIRSYALEDGKEVSIKFFMEGDFVADFESFRFETPSKYIMEAIENTLAYCGKKAEVVPVLGSDPSLNTLALRSFQELYFRELDHSNSFKMLPPEERYLQIIEKYPHYLHRLSLSHLASYLGISRKTLTRIRKKLKTGN